jgi:hypothetical protein
MKTIINYKPVQPGTHEFLQLQAFARSFDHTIIEHPRINVFAHYRDNVLFGYSDHVYVPTVYPAFHPEFTKPSDVLQVMKDWRAASQLNGSPGYIGVPTIGIGRENFNDKVMNKLGLTKTDREIFIVSPVTISKD